jgi:hypothetical protein
MPAYTVKAINEARHDRLLISRFIMILKMRGFQFFVPKTHESSKKSHLHFLGSYERAPLLSFLVVNVHPPLILYGKYMSLPLLC